MTSRLGLKRTSRSGGALLLTVLLHLWSPLTLAQVSQVSDVPLRTLGAHIEQTGNCSPDLIKWNRDYLPSTVAGETPRDFYYRVLSYTEWGDCGPPFLRPVLAELARTWRFYAKDLVSAAQFEAKETELVDLFFAALKDNKNGTRRVAEYERAIAARLYNLNPPRDYSNCTFFGNQLRCME